MSTLPRHEPSPHHGGVRSGAFLAVQTALRTLNEDWLVVPAPRWNTLDSEGRVISDRIDFVLAHPRHGILALAVVEGGLAHDPARGTWFRLGADGERIAIPDPFARARNAALSLGMAFARADGLPLPGPRFAHALWLPDLAPSPGIPDPEALPELIATADDLDAVEPRLRAILAGFPETRPVDERQGRRARARLEAMLATPWEVRPLLSAALGRGQRQILRLTEEQFQVLDLLASNPRVSVAGGAGTGKTMLALEKALRLAASGVPTLLTCFNRPLGHHLRVAARGRGPTHSPRRPVLDPSAFLSVDHFHKFAYERVHGWRPIAESDLQIASFWDEILPTRFLEYLDAHPTDRFDALVVDEGQDFSPREWTALELLLRDPRSGVFYVFHDENQAIFREHSAVPRRGMVLCRLERNLRNARPICEDLLQDFEGRGLRPAGPPGRPVERIPYAPGNLLPALLPVLHRLIDEEGVHPGDIAILSPRRHGSAIPSGPLGPFPVQDGEGTSPERLVVETVQRFKGLERPVVILAEMEDARPEKARKIRYTAASRACLHLIKMVRQAPGTDPAPGLRAG